ncbi:MAG: hypothetical protein M3Y18_06675 [Candidatus Eremiobacteraeota bacterium]|nr:hypothetical protein [Candidatus Eremiobacteraeota bacterium]
MRIAWFAIVLFTMRFAVIGWYYPLHDGDIAWQAFLGKWILAHHALPHTLGSETFTAAGARWIPQEWILGLAVAETLPYGRFVILTLVVALLGGLALFLTAVRARMRGATSSVTGLAVLLAGISIAEMFGVRAQIAAWPLLAALLLLLELDSPWSFAAVPTVALWANIHASAPIAVVFVAVRTIGLALDDRAWSVRFRRSLAIVVGTFAALFFTPLTWRLPSLAIALLHSPIRATIQEWQPPDIYTPSWMLGVVPLLALAIVFGVKTGWKDRLLVAAGVALSVQAIRYLPLAAIVIAPIVVAALPAALTQRARRVDILMEGRLGAVLLTIWLIAMTAGAGWQILAIPAAQKVTLPVRAIATVAKKSGTRRLFCENFNWCSLALSYANVRVFVDGRTDTFPRNVWRDYIAISRVKPEWNTLARRYRIDDIVVSTSQPLYQALQNRSDWKRTYADARYAVYTRFSAQKRPQ